MPRQSRTTGSTSRGTSTRKDILAAAVSLASVEGLESLSIGTLATELGMSKAGLFAHFGSKEALQVATVEAARVVFNNEVVLPARGRPPGIPQFQSYIDAYLSFVQRRVHPGGCFFTAMSTEFDDRRGPVRSQVRAFAIECRDLLEQTIREAQALDQIHAWVDPAQVVFEAMALVRGTIVTYQLLRDPILIQRARLGMEGLLERVRIAPPASEERPSIRRGAERA